MTITKEEEIKPHLGHDRPVVVGHFKTNKNLKYKYFSEVINQIDEVDAMCSFGDAEVEEPMDSFTVYNANGRPFRYKGSSHFPNSLMCRMGKGSCESLYHGSFTSIDRSLSDPLESLHVFFKSRN